MSRFSGNSNVNMYYGDSSSFKVRVYNNDGNPVGANQIVTMKLNKKTFLNYLDFGEVKDS